MLKESLFRVQCGGRRMFSETILGGSGIGAVPAACRLSIVC